MSAIARARTHSDTKLAELRVSLDRIVRDKSVVVLTCGSYARREASQASDIDFFIITDQSGEAREPSWITPAKIAISTIIETAPASDGAFATTVQRDAMLRNIGGNDDTNVNITHRMLFLLEGEWLFNQDAFKCARREILERYIGSTITDHQLALFLLNDIIRYYRTMAVDYEFKTAEGKTPKPWAIRNIKLIFSRKLLYASGLFSVAMTADRTREQKIYLLERLFDLPVIDRMTEICGHSNMVSLLKSYDCFLSKLEDHEVRTHLDGLTREDRGDKLFRELKNEGHYFNQQLMKLFESSFGSTHPIRRAVVF